MTSLRFPGRILMGFVVLYLALMAANCYDSRVSKFNPTAPLEPMPGFISEQYEPPSTDR